MIKTLTLFILVTFSLVAPYIQSQTVQFNYTGSMQSWVVPPCVYTINVVIAGAKGGGTNGGNGARITANIAVTPGQTLYIYCGGMGNLGSNSGGWNGGGTGHNASGNYSSWGGGGASDIRINGTALLNRVIVAGGGGGRSGGSSPVCGAVANCNNGAQGCNTFGTGGGGGTQTAGGNGGTPWAGVPPGGSPGSLGQGGQGGFWQTASGGGGGGGFYGGGGGGNDGCCTGGNGGGGGGSGSSMVPAGGSCLAGNNNNHGYVTITYSGGGAVVSATNNGPICSGGTLQLSTTSVGTYSWTGPNGFTSTAQNPAITNVTSANAGTYSVTVNMGACIGTATTTVVINPSPVVTTTGSVICAGNPGTVTATVTPSMPGTYAWNTGASGSTLSASPNSTTLYTVTFTPTGGCPGTSTAAITVNPTPVITVLGTSICSGQSATLIASASVTGGTFTWNPGGLTGNSIVVSPNSSTTYVVSYSLPTGCTASNANATVVVNPSSTLSVNNATICFGQPATLTAVPSVPGGTFSWSNNATGSSINPFPSTTTSYTVTYTTTAGCTAPSATATVTVNPTPVITSTSATICAGQSATLNANTNTQGGVFTWNPGNITGATITVSPQTTTSYSLTYLSGAGCTSNTATGTVTVNPLATVTVNNQTICDGNTAILTATPSIPGGTFLWSNNATSASITINPTINTTYSVVYTSGSGCVSPTASGTVTVNPTPLVTVSLDTICVGQTGTITATSSLSNGTFAWNPGNFSTATIQDSPNQTTVYTVIFTSNLNCPSAPATGTILVNPNPSINVSNAAMCSGQTVSVTASSSIQGGVFTWNPGNVTGPTLTASPTATTTWTVSYSAATGCSANAQNVTVTVNGIPTLTIPNTTICVGQTATLTATPSIAGGTFAWSPGGGTSSSVSSTPNTTTTYNLVYTSPAGCVSASTSASMIVNPLPLITVGNATICNGQSATINSTTSITGGTYAWSNNMSTANITVSPSSTTTYTLNYTAPTGCQSNSAVATVTVNGVPTISIVNDTICNGQTGTLSSIVSIAGGTYAWSPGNQTSSNLTASPTANTTYTLSYSSAAGCSGASATGTIFVNPVPILSSTLASPSICSGDAVSIGLVSSVPNSTISWTNTQSNVTGSNPGTGTNINDVITSSSTATGTVSYTITASANNCSSPAQNISITVYPIPNVLIANDTICNGSQASLTAIPDVTGGTYIWSANAQTTASINVSPNQTTLYNVLYDYMGCINTASASVVVNPIPTVSLNSGNICLGDSLFVTASPNVNGGVYTWTPGGIGPQTIMANPSSTTAISVTYTLNNCTSPSATSNITVTPIPTVFIDDTTICNGQQASMTALVSQSGGTFDWSPGGIGLQTAFLSPNQNTSISVTYTLNGCVSNASTAMAYVNPMPVSAILSPIQSGCTPFNYLFSADTTQAYSNYTWVLSNGTTFSGSTISGTSLAGGCLDISLTNTLNGCATTLNLLDYLCSENPPIASFDASVNTFSEPVQSINFTNSSIGASTYSWNFGDGGTSNEDSPIHTFNSNNNGQTIYLTAISPLGCTDSTSLLIPFQEGLIYYIPNTFTPDGDKYNQTFKPVFTSGIDYQNYSMLIYNRWGEVIFETHNLDVGWDGSYGTEGLDVSTGVYTYYIIVKTPTADERIVITGHINLLK